MVRNAGCRGVFRNPAITLSTFIQLPIPRVRRSGAGVKRGLAEDLVIAPYALRLALMVAPEAACRNLQQLAAEDWPVNSASTKRSTTRHHGCAGRNARRGALVHGAPPGYEPTFAGLRAAGPSDATAVRV